MKSKIALLLAFAAFGSPAIAKSVDFDDLPKRVQRVIERNFDDDQLDDLSIKAVSNGRRIVVRLKLDDERDIRLTISSNGRILKLKEDLEFNDLSRLLRRLVEEFLDDDDVVEIERDTRGDRTTYIIKITSEDGDETRIEIDRDGGIRKFIEDLELGDIPRKVRRAVRELVSDLGEIEDIERIEVDGKVTYRIVVERDDETNVYILDENGNFDRE